MQASIKKYRSSYVKRRRRRRLQKAGLVALLVGTGLLCLYGGLRLATPTPLDIAAPEAPLVSG